MFLINFGILLDYRNSVIKYHIAGSFNGDLPGKLELQSKRLEYATKNCTCPGRTTATLAAPW